MGPRIREDNGRGEMPGVALGRGRRAVREPPLRGVGRTVECDGRPQGSPLREEGTERHDVGGQREGEGRFANRPYGRAERLNVTGDHKGRPYGGRDGEGGEMKGRFANRPCGGLAERLNVTGDHKGRPYGRKGGDGGWVPASARTTGGGKCQG